jgi:hypothetical protein
MFENFGNLIGRKPAQKGGPMVSEPASALHTPQTSIRDHKQTYSKIFRWRLPDGQTAEPATVEIVGTFTHWKPVPLGHDGKQDSWHAIIHHIEGNRTHHYMLLVDGKPAQDKNSDGYAVPHGPQEEQYALATFRGPRVFMLFGQAK